MVAFYLVFTAIIWLYAGFYCAPFQRGAVELPAFARTRDEDKSLRKELADLLRRRKGLEKTWEQGALMRGSSVLAAGDRWFLAVRLQKNVYAAALMAALCRLCPEGLPDDEADFWEKGFLSLMDEGEGQVLLGLSYLYLYETFAAENDTEQTTGDKNFTYDNPWQTVVAVLLIVLLVLVGVGYVTFYATKKSAKANKKQAPPSDDDLYMRG